MLAHITVAEVIPWVLAVSGSVAIGGMAGYAAGLRRGRNL